MEKVPNGVYRIIDGDVTLKTTDDPAEEGRGEVDSIEGYDTGMTMHVGSGESTVMEYFTLDYSITPSGGVSWAYLRAYYGKTTTDENGKTDISAVEAPVGSKAPNDYKYYLKSGTPVLKGAPLVFKAYGAPRFDNLYKPTFQWSPTNMEDLHMSVAAANNQTMVYQVTVPGAKLEVAATSTAESRPQELVKFTLDGQFRAPPGVVQMPPIPAMWSGPPIGFSTRPAASTWAKCLRTSTSSILTKCRFPALWPTPCRPLPW